MSICLHVSISIHHECVWCLQRSEESIRFLGTGVMDGSEPPCGCWEVNPGPLQEQQTFSPTEPSFQPCIQNVRELTMCEMAMRLLPPTLTGRDREAHHDGHHDKVTTKEHDTLRLAELMLSQVSLFCLSRPQLSSRGPLPLPRSPERCPDVGWNGDLQAEV